LVTPDDIRIDLEAGALTLEFLHKVPAGFYRFLETALGNLTPFEVDQLAAILDAYWPPQEVRDAVERAKEKLPDVEAFLTGQLCLKAADKMRNLEDRRVLLKLLAEWLS
jgi:hypothetical protein